jgi:WD40 repeat protein
MTPSPPVIATPTIEEKAPSTPEVAVQPSAQPTAPVAVAIPSPSISATPTVEAQAESGKLLATFKGHTGGVNSAVFSPDGRRVLTASEDKARLWEAESGKLLAAFKGYYVNSAVFSPDGRAGAYRLAGQHRAALGS